MRISILLAALCLVGQAWAVELESPIDVRFVSQLRVELRSVQEPDRCRLLWRGIEEKLEDKSSLDVVVLARLGQFLRTKMAYKLLAEFVDDCVASLSAKYRNLGAVPAKKDDDIGDVAVLLQEIDALQAQLADKERHVNSNNDALKMEQLAREKDEAMREANSLKLELEAAKKSACQADAAEAKLRDAVRELHKSSEMAVQQIRDEPAARLSYSQGPHQVREQHFESIPNPYASAAALAATDPFKWSAPAASSPRARIGSQPHQASFASAFASASG